MISSQKLAVFDIDGTIAEKGKIPARVISGMKHLHANGWITTVSTGRGYTRAKEALGDSFDAIISPEALMILEHGTKITDRAGKCVFGEFFSDDEITHVADFIRANNEMFKLVWYNPLDVSRKVEIWCQDAANLDEETAKRGHYARVFTSPIGALEELLLKEKLTNITMRLENHIKVENLKLSFTRTATNIIFQDGNVEFIKNNINKGLALNYVASKLNIDAEDILVAGNAINDVEMLDTTSGRTILVGAPDTREIIMSYMSNTGKDDIACVDNPVELGNYLLKL